MIADQQTVARNLLVAMESTFLAQFLQRAIDEPDRLILIAIKGRYPFATSLINLDLHDCLSVLLLNKVYAQKVPPDHLARFDFVNHFDAGEFWATAGALSHLDSLEFPQLDAWFELLIENLKTQSIDTSRLRLVALEEQFVRVTAKIRQRHDIVGAKPMDVDRFTDKARMKRVADEAGLPSTKYDIVSPSELIENAKKLSHLETSLGYPIMFKPLHGVGASDIEKIDNRIQLNDWIETHHHNDTLYVAEEYIDGQEYHTLVLVQQSSVQLFSAPCVVRGSSIWNSIRHGVPLCTDIERDPWKRAVVEEFVHRTIEVFRPLEGGLAFVQAFMNKDGRMQLSEIANRVPGMIGSVMFMENSGISPESVKLMAQLRPLDLNQLSATGRKRKKYFCNLVYPKREGVVKIVQQLDKKELRSEVEVTYAVKAGDKIKAATNVGDMAVRIFLWNDDGDQLTKDSDWLRDNYCPVVIEE